MAPRNVNQSRLITWGGNPTESQSDGDGDNDANAVLPPASSEGLQQPAGSDVQMTDPLPSGDTTDSTSIPVESSVASVRGAPYEDEINDGDDDNVHADDHEGPVSDPDLDELYDIVST